MSNQTNLADRALNKWQSGASAHETSHVFTYEGAEITFLNKDDVTVNASQMAKPFGKKPADWLKNQQSTDYLNALSVMRNIATADLVQVRRGGNPRMQGTYMHQDVAIEFARWLSPAFAIWTNDRIKELLTEGVATISNDDDVIANAMAILQRRLDASKQQIQALEGQTRVQKNLIEVLSPKAEYTDEVLNSTRTYTMTEMAKELQFRSVGMFTRHLKDKRVIFRHGDLWMLTAKYAGNDYSKVRTHPYLKADGTIGSSSIMVWTERGRWFLHQLTKGGRNER